MGEFYYVVAVISALFVGRIAVEVLKPVKKADYRGKNVIVTGGSQGMGKSVAKQFVQRGANVTIIARTQSTLDSACAELKTLVRTEDQVVRALSVDCTDSKAIVNAIDEIGTPDVVFCCAGKKESSGHFSTFQLD